MKVLAILLVCAVAVHGRSTAVEPVKSGRSVAALGDAPWLVHLRIAIETSGFLNSAIGSLISQTIVLTSANAVQGARFIWIRYGAVNVINPELVIESSAVIFHGNLALINKNRVVHSTPNISPVALSADYQPESAQLYVYGENDGRPGEQLSSFTVSLTRDTDNQDLIIASSEDDEVSEFDLGAPLVADGKQIGVLIKADGNSAVFQSVSEDLVRQIIA